MAPKPPEIFSLTVATPDTSKIAILGPVYVFRCLFFGFKASSGLIVDDTML